MLGPIIKTQILENLFGIKFIVTMVICLLLVLGVTMTGIARYENQLAADQNIKNINKANLEEAENWRDVGEDGIKVIKSATSLSIFSTGLDESVGRTATVHEWDFPHMEDSIYSTTPIFAVFGDLDLTFIIKIVISLFAILFTYDLISGEKERGTLKLCLSNSVPRNTYILGKSIGSFISLILALFLPLILGLLLVLTYGNINFTGEEWARVGIIIVGYVLYMLSFFSLGLFVSTLTKRSSISFLVLLFIWVLLVLVVPKASMMIAAQVSPVDMGISDVRDEQLHMQRDFRNSIWQETQNEMRTMDRASMSRDEWHTTMFNLRREISEELEPKFRQDNERLIDDFKQAQTNLTSIAMSLSRISPASAVTYIGMGMAGTGFDAQEFFLDQLTTYRAQFAKTVEKLQEGEMAKGPGPFGGQNESGTLDVDQLPVIQLVKLDFADSLAAVLPDLMMMAILSIIFYALAFVLFIRYDVR